MRNRILSIVLIIVLLSGTIFILTGCGSNNDKGNKASDTEKKEQSTKLVDLVNVGDYVNYNANSGDGIGKSYITDESLTGSKVTGTFSSSEEMKWKVMSIDKNTGIVELMAENPTKNYVYLIGKTGYKNAEIVLNEVGKVYGYGDGAIDGRSITIEDVNKLEEYTPTDDSSSFTYTGGTFINEDGTEVVATAENPVTMKYTATTAEKSTNMNYNYTTKNFSGKFWLASRCVNFYDDSCHFNVRCVNNRYVSGWDLTRSNYSGTEQGYRFQVMPVVSLKSNIQTSGKDERGAWNLIIE